jgi:ProP effector
MSEQQSAPENKEISQKKIEAKRKKEYEANRKALDELCELYPEVFSPTAPKPLQIGVHEAIAADGKLSKTRIRRALNLYVRMRKYIACLTEGTDRVTLGGEVTGQVTAEEAQHAQEKLAEIDKRRAARKPGAGSKGPRKPARKQGPAKTSKGTQKPRKPKTESAPKDEDPLKAEERFQAKLEALVNKRSN